MMPEASQPAARRRSEAQALKHMHAATARCILWCLVMILSVGCSKDEAGKLPEPTMDVPKFVAAAPLTKSPAGFDWPGKPYAKVVAYHFQPPELWGQFSVGDDATVIHAERLQATAREASSLQATQVERLLTSVLKPESVATSAACYDPEHVFVFYSADNKPIAALEICFGCRAIRSWPDIELARYHDMAGLAKLADELAVWATSCGSLTEYLAELHQEPVSQ